MPKRSAASRPMDDALLDITRRKAIPHEFVLDAIADLSPVTRPMFGCIAVYIEDKIVIILRDKRDGTPDNGVWLATTVPKLFLSSLLTRFAQPPSGALHRCSWA